MSASYCFGKIPAKLSAMNGIGVSLPVTRTIAAPPSEPSASTLTLSGSIM